MEAADEEHVSKESQQEEHEQVLNGANTELAELDNNEAPVNSESLPQE